MDICYRDEFERGELAEVRASLERKFAAHADSPFAVILERKFSNPVAEVAAEMRRFYDAEGGDENKICVLYTETNGFSWNLGEWFHNWFGYTLPLGHPDLEMSGYDSVNNPIITLTGLEDVQKIYQDAEENQLEDDAEGLCTMMVIVRFYELIIAAVETFDDFPVPLVLDTHGMDHALEVRRHCGVTYLGRQNRSMDEFGDLPTKFDQLRESDQLVAFNLGVYYSETRWLHRVRCDYQVDEVVKCEYDCCRFEGKRLADDCGRMYHLLCEPLKLAEGWPDWVCSHQVVVSARLRAFLMAQEGAADAYQWIDPIYPPGAEVPDIGYKILNLLDHRKAVDKEATVYFGDDGKIRDLALRKEEVEGCRHLFRIADDPIRGGILLSRQLAWDLHDAGFSGLNFQAVAMG